MFKRLDTDKDGLITIDEMKNGLLDDEEYFTPGQIEDILRVLGMVKKDSSSGVTFSQMLKTKPGI